MAEGGEGGYAGGVDEVAGVGEDVNVCSEGPDLGVRCKWIFYEKGWFRAWRELAKKSRVGFTFCPAIRQSDSVESA